MVKLNELLLSGVSLLAVGAVVSPALAQDQGVETIVVTGIRASLQSSQNIKRNADVFVDSITAEDIGALPDRSVTEALQRVPGVQINYFAGANDPDHFSAEGSGITIRGLSDTQSLLNGRETFSANNGRIISFADVPPELMSGVDVFKSPSADMIEGGIGGTVNLRTRVPFDQDGQLIAASVDGTWGDKAHKFSFDGSGLYSNRWSTPIGEFGFLANVSRSQLFIKSDGTQIAAWGPGNATTVPNPGFGGPFSGQPIMPNCPATCYIPAGADTRVQHYNHERQGFASAAQWKSNDGTMLATLQFIRSDANETWNEDSRDVAADVVAGGGSTPNPPSAGYEMPLPGTQWNFDKNGLFENGYITQLSGWRSADPTVPLWGVQAQDITRGVVQELITNDFSGHLRWTPTDRWAFDLDAQHVWSSTNNVDVQTMIGNWDTVKIDTRGDIPKVQFLPPTNDAAQDPNVWFTDPGNYFWRSAMDHIEQSTGHENAFRADAEYMLNTGWLDSIKVGGRYSDREQDVRYTTYNWGALSEVWDGSGGPIWLGQNSYAADNIYGPLEGNPGTSCYCAVAPNSRPAAAIMGADLVKAYTYPGFQGGDVPTPVHGLFLKPGNPAKYYGAFSQNMLAINQAWQSIGGSSGWVPVGMRPGVVPGTPFLPNEINNTQEKTRSLYAMLRFGSEGPITGNIGVRWYHTEDTANGFVAYPTSVGTGLQGPTPQPICNPNQGTLPAICNLPPAQQQPFIQFCNPVKSGPPTGTPPVQNWVCAGGSQTQNARNTFDDLLPSFNAKVKLTDDMLIRVGLSQSITRPDMGYLRDYTQLSPTGLAAPDFFTYTNTNTTVGNPFLKPVKSDNLDLAWEWYFADVGSLTVATFLKELHGYFTSDTVGRDFTNNGQTLFLNYAQPANARTTGEVKGFEAAWSQFFNFLPDPFDGLGINASYTFIDSGGVAPLNISNGGGNSVAGTGCTSPCIPGANAAFYQRLPLDQLSKHNINLEGIYEKGPIQFRIAWNWRSRFLLTARDVIYPFAPIYNEATGTLDGSFFYSVTPNLKFGIQGVNLLNEVTRTSQVVNTNMLTAGRSWFTTDRRLSLVVRAQY